MNRFILATSAAALASGGALSAAVVNFSGDTTGQSRFFRTTETGFESSQEVPYQVYSFTVDVSGTYDFGVVSGSPVFDTFISLYTPAFNPADSETNWLISNDDATGNSDDGSAFSYSLDAGTSYAFVVTGYLGAGAPDEGAFDASISGPGNATVTAVPEPGSALAGVLSAGLGFAFCSRRKAWRKRSSH